MTKRLRLLIILVLVAFGVGAFMPTLRWYFVVPEDQKLLAQSSRIEIRDWSRGEARSALDELRRDAASGAPLAPEYAFLIEVAEENLSSIDEEIPESWETRDVLASFRDEAEAYGTLEEHYRSQVLALKDMKERIVQLGLDLSGGISVTLEADRESLAERLGQAPSAAQMDEAVQLAVEIHSAIRIDRFGVTEPQLRVTENDRVVIDIPGDNDRERVNSFLLGKGKSQLPDRRQRRPQVSVAGTPECAKSWLVPGDRRCTPDFVPAGSEIAEYVSRDAYGIDERVDWIVIYEDIAQYGLDGYASSRTLRVARGSADQSSDGQLRP
jgi:preprotein translocase subunit SecD